MERFVQRRLSNPEDVRGDDVVDQWRPLGLVPVARHRATPDADTHPNAHAHTGRLHDAAARADLDVPQRGLETAGGHDIDSDSNSGTDADSEFMYDAAARCELDLLQRRLVAAWYGSGADEHASTDVESRVVHHAAA